MDIQCYPGHMTKAIRMMREDVKLVDLVIELTDARAPQSSRNPDIDELGKNKARVILLNKADLADQEVNRLWEKWYRSLGYETALINSKNGKGMKQVTGLIQSACKEKIARDQKRGINRPIRAMVAGIPNVGKSTFINSFAGKACTKTGNKPGVTKGKQWIRLNKNVELLDTPGILWPKIEDEMAGRRLAALGTIKDEILQVRELALWLITFLEKYYPGVLSARYRISKEDNETEILDGIARARGCIKKGAEPDEEKASALLLDDFRSGKLGGITLEFVSELEETSGNAKRNEE